MQTFGVHFGENLHYRAFYTSDHKIHGQLLHFAYGRRIVRFAVPSLVCISLGFVIMNEVFIRYFLFFQTKGYHLIGKRHLVF